MLEEKGTIKIGMISTNMRNVHKIRIIMLWRLSIRIQL